MGTLIYPHRSHPNPRATPPHPTRPPPRPVTRLDGTTGPADGQAPEVADADASAARAAIETHAVTRARRYLEAQGSTVRDVGATESYDLDATRPGERLHVEVKGTTSAGAEVVLTRNEVLLNADRYPHTVLVVVRDVELDRTTTPPRAGGGRTRVVHPWAVAGRTSRPSPTATASDGRRGTGTGRRSGWDRRLVG
ncbi:protein NO VEIN domain-containing protein [Saccharothrix texasensis]|uniref:protein NO VEIN domain-containing protein n=1 Tax=Saccharothrix texasensis TaxID=103734 RepID=UPI0014774FFA|nr:DUF3883 domain-containing protein [Saccharothrix texasensis]